MNVTLGGDVDFAFFGLDAEQRRKETDPRTALLEILANGPSEGMDEQEIYDSMEEKGFSRKKSELTLKQMREEGIILQENVYGKYRKT